MTWALEMQLPYPPSLNAYKDTRVITSKGRNMVLYYLTKEALAFKAECRRIADHCRITPILGPIEYVLELYPHLPLDWRTRAKRDPMWWDATVRCIDSDNAVKVLLDALNGIAWTDDSMVFDGRQRRMCPTSESMCILRVKPFERVELPLPVEQAATLPLDLPMTDAERRLLATTRPAPDNPRGVPF